MTDDVVQVDVVFHDGGAWPWSKYLRPGFRHCFPVVFDGEHWIALDSTQGYVRPHVACYRDREDAMRSVYATMGSTVVPLEAERAAIHPSKLFVGSCVGLTQAVLGVHKPWIFTPYQLYRHLTGLPDVEVYRPS